MSTSLVLEQSRDGQRAVIESSSTVYVVLVIVFVLVGAPLLVFGLLTVAGDSAGGEDVATGLFLTAAGLFLTGAAVLILIRPTQPKKMIFNNDLAALELIERGRNAPDKIFRLPYAQIKGFRVVRHVSTSRSNSSGGGTQTRYRWHAVMDKRDGAAWTLLVENKEIEAQEAVAKIKKCVDLTREPRREEGDLQSGRFNLDRRDGRAVITWTPPWRFFRAISSLMVTGGVMTGIIGWYTIDGGFAPLVVGGFIGLLVLLALISAVGSFVRPPGIEITPDQLLCRAGGLLLARTWTAPLSEVHTITFRFSPNEASGHLLVLNANQAEQLTRMMQGTAGGDIMAMFNIMMSAHKIDITGLSTGQSLELETLLQNQIAAVTGQTVA